MASSTCTSAWKGLSSRVREIHAGGVVIRDGEPGTVDVEIHVRVAWGRGHPRTCRAQVEEAVRAAGDRALLSIDLGTVTLFVDEIAGPAEVGTPQEG